MYHRYAGPVLEELVRTKAELFEARLFGSETWVVVQNASMEKWLRLEIARLRGLCAGLRFRYADAALRDLVEGFSDPSRDERPLLYIDDLKLALYTTFKAGGSAWQSKPDWKVLRDFLVKESATGKLAPWADTVAGLFHNYYMNAPEIIEVLAGLRSIPQVENNPHFGWQRELWSKIFGPEGSYRHLGGLTKSLGEEGREWRGLRGKKDPVLVLVGSAFLSAQASAFVGYASRFLEIHQLMLSPSPSLVADTGARGQGQSGPVNSLLKQWGAVALSQKGIPREDLNGQPGPDLASAWIPPYETDGPPLSTDLGRCVAALRSDSPEILPLAGELSREAPVPPPDGTLAVFSATGALRELELLKDWLLKEIDDQGGGLALNEIAVMAPDINVYAPLVEAVFSREPKLNHNMIDLAWSGQSAYLGAVKALIGLLRSRRFGRDEVFPFLRNPCVMEAWSIGYEHVEAWKRFAQSTGAYRSFSDPARPWNTWGRAFERSAEGMAFSAESGDSFALPGSGSLFRIQGKLWEIMRVLDEAGKALASGARNLETWIQWWENLEGRCLKPRRQKNDESEAGAVRKALRSLLNSWNTLVDGEAKESRLEGSAFLYFLETQLPEDSGIQGEFMTQGISFCSFRPLRAVPFKIIALLGMNEGDFPPPDRRPAFDLGEGLTHIPALDPRELGRFSFLETFCSVREKLWIFYTGKDPVSGEEKQPALPVQELLDWAGSAVLTERHRIQFYHEDYLKADGPFFTYRPDADRLGSVVFGGPRTKRRSNPDLRLDSLPEEVVTGEIDWNLRLNFTVNPLKTALQELYRLKFVDEDDPEEDTELPLEPDFPELWGVLENWYRGKNEKTETAPASVREHFEKMKANGLFPPGFVEKAGERRWEFYAQKLEESWNALLPEGAVPESGDPRDRLSGFFVGPDGLRVLPFLLKKAPKGKSAPSWKRLARAYLSVLAHCDSAQAGSGFAGYEIAFLPFEEGEAFSLPLAPLLPEKPGLEAYTSRLASFRQSYYGNPFPLSADFAERLWSREPDFDPIYLKEAWEDFSLRDDFAFSSPLCPYHGFAFPASPDFAALADSYREAYEALYRPLKDLATEIGKATEEQGKEARA